MAVTSQPDKAEVAKKAAFTIINTKTRGQFIQQRYTVKKDATARLAALKQKFGDQYSLAVVTVDDRGNFQDIPEEE